MKIHLTPNELTTRQNLIFESLQRETTSPKSERAEAERKMDNIEIARENIQAAGMKIPDMKKAEELLTMVRAQILDEATKAFLTHSNIEANRALEILSM